MATAHKSRVLDMTQGDPFRLVLQFSMPLFCSNLLQQLYNLTDTALAGHLLGSAALAEIGATAALYGLIMNFAFGMNNGLALTVSRCFGAGEREGIRRKPEPDTVLHVMKEFGSAKCHTLYVGDSDVDVQTARNAGVDCAAVLWGFRSEEHLKNAGARHLFRSPKELCDWILSHQAE